VEINVISMNGSVNKRKRNTFCKCAFEWQIFIAEVRHYAAYEVNELSSQRGGDFEK
jgi:hypothetical protein